MRRDDDVVVACRRYVDWKDEWSGIFSNIDFLFSGWRLKVFVDGFVLNIKFYGLYKENSTFLFNSSSSFVCGFFTLNKTFVALEIFVEDFQFNSKNIFTANKGKKRSFVFINVHVISARVLKYEKDENVELWWAKRKENSEY